MAINIDKVIVNRGLLQRTQNLTARNDKLVSMLCPESSTDVFSNSAKKSKGLRGKLENYVCNMIESAFNYKHLDIK